MFFQCGTYSRGRLWNLLWQQFQSLLGEDGVLWDHRRGSSWRRRWRWRMGRTGGARRKPFGVQARGHPRELPSLCPPWTSMLLYNVYLGIRRSSIDDVYNLNGAGWRTGSVVEAVKGKLTPRRQGKWKWEFKKKKKKHIHALWPFQRLYSCGKQQIVHVNLLSTMYHSL